ncbi:MAG: hypothetical protein P1V81_02165 [Planctomycetota bacterium]|nr:hypothetical protein [Planctomycetota bacterium]
MKTSTFAATLTLCALPALGFAQDAPELPADERIREAWSYLRPDEQAEVTEWFRAEVGYLETYQGKLIQYLLDTSEVDRGLFPEPQPLPFYDPAEHAPAQPIKRKRLDASSSKAEKEYERLVGRFDADPLRRAWRYDWASGAILRIGDERDPELLFENAMLGLPPLIDLAEAMLQQRLDDGSQRQALAAFGHAYTDRNGNLFPNITLYDAWCSGQEIEMPDVDVLGIVHDLWDEWKKWKAPIPTSQHKKLYAQVGDVLVDAKHHRQLREALAASYLRGKAVPSDLYKPNNLAFNGLWDEFGSDPAALLEDLPKADDWEDYLKDLTSRIARKKPFREAGQVRLDYLEADRWRTKNTLVWVLTEFGAFDRTELPPEPEPKPAPRSDEAGA